MLLEKLALAAIQGLVISKMSAQNTRVLTAETLCLTFFRALMGCTTILMHLRFVILE